MPSFQYTRPPTKSTRLHAHDIDPLESVEVPFDVVPSTRTWLTGTPSTPPPEPTARYSSSTTPRSQTVMFRRPLRYSPPVWKCCSPPPGTVARGDAGRPGAHINPSYAVRIPPVMMRLLLIHTRSSGSPSAARSSVPVSVADPVDPAATARMI